MLIGVLALLVADCAGARGFTPLAPVLPTAVAGVSLARTTTLPPVYYDTSSDHPACVGAGDVLSGLRRAETAGVAVDVVTSRRGAPVPVTIALVQQPASLRPVDDYLARCRQYLITSGELGPARVQLRAEPGHSPAARAFAEVRTLTPTGTRVFTRTLLARSGGWGLLVVIGPSTNLPTDLVDAARTAGLAALTRR